MVLFVAAYIGLYLFLGLSPLSHSAVGMAFQFSCAGLGSVAILQTLSDKYLVGITQNSEGLLSAQLRQFQQPKWWVKSLFVFFLLLVPVVIGKGI